MKSESLLFLFRLREELLHPPAVSTLTGSRPAPITNPVCFHLLIPKHTDARLKRRLHLLKEKCSAFISAAVTKLKCKVASQPEKQPVVG